MRKCPRCQIVYQSTERLNCLYCDATLISVQLEDALRLQEEDFVKGRSDFLDNYFRIRSFTFSYIFHRNQLRMGQKFERFFVEPLGFSYLIKIPWIIINCVDSVMIHLAYQGYCPQCGWKHKRMSGVGDHSKEECEYNKEYVLLLKEIVTGGLIRDENKYKKEAVLKVQAGQRNAYNTLCSRRTALEYGMDILSILISMALFMAIPIKIGMVLLGKVYEF